MRLNRVFYVIVSNWYYYDILSSPIGNIPVGLIKNNITQGSNNIASEITSYSNKNSKYKPFEIPIYA